MRKGDLWLWGQIAFLILTSGRLERAGWTAGLDLELAAEALSSSRNQTFPTPYGIAVTECAATALQFHPSSAGRCAREPAPVCHPVAGFSFQFQIEVGADIGAF